MEVQSKALILSTIVLSLSLTGCGGSSGSSTAAPATESTNTTVTGAVADGYLYGATVCLDLNDNKRCDDAEPMAISGNNGQYSLSNVSAADAAKHGVVVEVSASTIDEDTGNPVGKTYILTSPPGKPEFVSPLSTLVHTTMDMLKVKSDDAEHVVKQNMDFGDEDISLFNDYIKAGSNTTAQQLHKIAQITAHILGQNHQLLNEAIQREGVDASEQSVAVHNLLLRHVFSQLANIKTIVLAKSDDSPFSESELAALDVQLSTANIKNKLEKESEIRAATTKFDIKKLFEIEGGLSSIDKYSCFGASCTNGFSYDKDTITLSVNADLTYDWEHNQETYSFGVWSSSSNFYWDHYYMLIDGAWVYRDARKTGSKQTNIQTNQIAVEPGQLISFIEFDIAGKKIVPFLASSKNLNITEDIVREVAGSNAAFGVGAKAYLSSTMANADLYLVDLENDFNSCVGTTIVWVDESTNCNTVQSGDPREGLRSIDELFVASNDKEIHTNRFVVTLNRTDINANSGTVEINLTNTSLPSMSSSWELREVSPGVSVVAIKIPAKMKKRDSWYRFGQTEVFFAVVKGYLRAGEFTPAGAVTEWAGYEFNSVAMGDILEQFNP